MSTDMYRSVVPFLLVLTTSQVLSDYVTVTTEYGQVRGRVDSEATVPVSKFYGIPYAAAPTGSRRFLPPAPLSPWTGVKDALEFGPECYQYIQDSFRYNNSREQWRMSEDCLFLNVYSTHVTQQNETSLLPVMVWIHGGGYCIGGGSEYDGTSLATKGVVMVTINYRLDIFGFLSTEDAWMPGNYGMLDQVAALKWVEGNIKAFGGDPGQVTIFGESAGASSVSLHILSPLSKGLFHRAIMQSGSALSPWANHYRGYKLSHKMAAQNVTESVGCGNYTNSVDILKCLQSVDAGNLVNVSVANSLDPTSGYAMNPRVDSESGFLPEDPISLLSKGNFSFVDTIRGFNVHEFGFWYASSPQVNTSVDVTAAIRWFESMSQGYTEMTKLTQLLEYSYITQNSSSDQLRSEIISGLSDFMFIGPTEQSAKMISLVPSLSKHYIYQFNYRHSQSKMPSWLTAVHTDEIDFVFNVSLTPFVEARRGPPNATDVQVSEQMMTMWTNFAKTGSPMSPVSPGHLAWPEFSYMDRFYLDITDKPTFNLWQRPEIFHFNQIVLNILEDI